MPLTMFTGSAHVSLGTAVAAQLWVSLGRLRMNQVFVVGEVARPDAYQVSAAATVLHALYQAGGPKETGTFRAIEVVSANGARRTVDLYDYLLYGDSRTDVRLEHGDRVFVPNQTMVSQTLVNRSVGSHPA